MFLHPSTIQPAGMMSLLIISSLLQPWLGIGIEGDACRHRHFQHSASQSTPISDSVPSAGFGMGIL
jgi:hypothetical protein